MSELGKLLRDLRGGKSLREVGQSTGVSHTYISTVEKGFDSRKKTQKEVADANDLKESTLRMWELGKNQPSPHVLRKLAQYYNFDYIELMKAAGYINNKDIENHRRVE